MQQQSAAQAVNSQVAAHKHKIQEDNIVREHRAQHQVAFVAIQRHVQPIRPRISAIIAATSIARHTAKAILAKIRQMMVKQTQVKPT